MRLLDEKSNCIRLSCEATAKTTRGLLAGLSLIYSLKRNNGKTVRQRTVRQETTKYKSGTLPFNMYRTEEEIGEKLQFDGASEEREEAIEGDKYSDESGADPDRDLSDDEVTRQNLSFLRTTRSGRNIFMNKKYGV